MADSWGHCGRWAREGRSRARGLQVRVKIEKTPSGRYRWTLEGFYGEMIAFGTEETRSTAKTKAETARKNNSRKCVDGVRGGKYGGKVRSTQENI